MELASWGKGVEMEVVIVTEEMTGVCEGAGFDGGEAVIAGEVVVLNGDVMVIKSGDYVSND